MEAVKDAVKIAILKKIIYLTYIKINKYNKNSLICFLRYIREFFSIKLWVVKKMCLKTVIHKIV